MDQKSEFDRLEQYVSKLLSQYDQLRDENARLQERLNQRGEEIRELKAQVSSADSERGDISIRIKGLIDKIEEWEAAFDGEKSAPQTESTSSATAEDSGSAEDVNEDAESAEAAGEKEKNQQQNLFNVQPRRDSFGN